MRDNSPRHKVFAVSFVGYNLVGLFFFPRWDIKVT